MTPAITTLLDAPAPDAATLASLSDALGSAFADDPFFNYMLPANLSAVDREARMRHLFAGMLSFAVTQPRDRAPIHMADDGSSCALWLPSEKYKPGGRDGLGALWGVALCFRWQMLNFLRVADTIERAHPTQPHAYLWVLGTARAAQGRGLGSRVISKMLAQCDEQALPAYLESSNERNIAFYQRHGFRVMHKIEGLPKDCPPITAMWRDPRPPAPTEDGAE